MPIGKTHHRNARDSLQETSAGEIVLTDSETALRAGAEDFARRKQLIVVNDSSGMFFISDENPFDLGIGAKFTVFSGESVIINFEQDRPITWYGKTDDSGISLTIRVVEIR